MRTKFKQWWWTIPPISTKGTVTSHLESDTEHKNGGGGTMIYDAGKPEPGLISAQKYGKVKLVNGIPLSW